MLVKSSSGPPPGRSWTHGVAYAARTVRRGQEPQLHVVADRSARDPGGLDQLLDAVSGRGFGVGHIVTVLCRNTTVKFLEPKFAKLGLFRPHGRLPFSAYTVPIRWR